MLRDSCILLLDGIIFICLLWCLNNCIWWQFIISSFYEKNPSNNFQITTKVLYECKRGLDGRISDCELAIHAKCYDELRKMDDSVKNVRNRRNESNNNNTMMTLLDEQNTCCHHSLKHLQVHTNGAYWKFKKYSLHLGIGNYPQGVLSALDYFGFEYFSAC